MEFNSNERRNSNHEKSLYTLKTRSSPSPPRKFLYSGKIESDNKQRHQIKTGNRQNTSSEDRSPPRKLSSYSQRTRRSRSLRKRSGTSGSAPAPGVRSHSSGPQRKVSSSPASAISWCKDLTESNHSVRGGIVFSES